MATKFKFRCTANLNLRVYPKTDNSPVIMVMAKNSVQEAVGVSGKWYKVMTMYKGEPYGGWCYSEYCEKIETEKPKETAPVNQGLPTTKPSPSSEQLATAQEIDDKIALMVSNKRLQLESGIDGSMRLFGLPHQLTENNDYRLSSKTRLGRMFAETFIMDAPIIYLKPGTSNFLPGLSQEERENITKGIVDIGMGGGTTKQSLAAALAEVGQSKSDSNIRYFDFIQKNMAYLKRVNLLCRIGAVFLDIDKLDVPWVGKGDVTYGTYNWRHYIFSSVYAYDSEMWLEDQHKDAHELSAFIPNVCRVVNTVLDNDKWLQFYVDANASFSESSSNSTTSSALNGFFDTTESIGKELAFVSAASGADIDGLIADTLAGSVDGAVEKVLGRSDGQLATFLKRLTGTTTQTLQGSNFVIPDIWSDSDYSKNYSFNVTLATPYGTTESWYLNIYVPMMHLLALMLPEQTSANTFSAPPLIRAFCPGWFSCDMGIIDSMSIEKGGSGDAWSSSGLPNEVRISISIKDLFSALAMPAEYSIKDFFNNTTMLHFLMVNCGVDMSKNHLDDMGTVMANLFLNNLTETLPNWFYGKWDSFQTSVQKLFRMY